MTGRNAMGHQARDKTATAAGRLPPQAGGPGRDPYEERRPHYAREIRAGTARFFEPRRADCPWCSSPRLRRRVRTADLIQRKPGTFVLDECRTCRHVFQNPRLSPAGLNFYYRDFYDGLGQSVMEPVFDGAVDYNRARARLVARHTTPRRWLDVGTGYGHFAKHAREVLPEVTFDGLDRGVAVAEGARRGWLANAHRGSFPELAASLSGHYDVLSMHHYLEHTPDPRAELDAAAAVLAPGGHFLIEVPDPEYVLGRLLGRWWMSLLQPQHLNLIPLSNLLVALCERGFRPVAVETGRAHMATDVTWAVVQLLAVVAPDPRMPWLAQPPTSGRLQRHEFAWQRLAPRVFPATSRLDRALTTLARHGGHGNAYRVLARKE